MTGTIPSNLFSLPNIQYIYLSNNTIGGTLPPNVFGGARTIDIFIDGNLISGPIPNVTSPLVNICTFFFCFYLRFLNNYVFAHHSIFSSTAQVLLNNNLLTGSVPSGLCTLRSSKPLQFKSLHADCTPGPVSFIAQTPCANLCCTDCFVGPLAV
jgi:hypothetical protein